MCTQVLQGINIAAIRMGRSPQSLPPHSPLLGWGEREAGGFNNREAGGLDWGTAGISGLRIWEYLGQGSCWCGMWGFLAWGELARRGMPQRRLDDETESFPSFLQLKNLNHLNNDINSSIRKKKLYTGRLQRIVSLSNPSWKHAPRVVSCQLSWLAS